MLVLNKKLVAFAACLGTEHVRAVTFRAEAAGPVPNELNIQQSDFEEAIRKSELEGVTYRWKFADAGMDSVPGFIGRPWSWPKTAQKLHDALLTYAAKGRGDVFPLDGGKNGAHRIIKIRRKHPKKPDVTISIEMEEVFWMFADVEKARTLSPDVEAALFMFADVDVPAGISKPGLRRSNQGEFTSGDSRKSLAPGSAVPQPPGVSADETNSPADRREDAGSKEDADSEGDADREGEEDDAPGREAMAPEMALEAMAPEAMALLTTGSVGDFDVSELVGRSLLTTGSVGDFDVSELVDWF